MTTKKPEEMIKPFYQPLDNGHYYMIGRDGTIWTKYDITPSGNVKHRSLVTNFYRLVRQTRYKTGNMSVKLFDGDRYRRHKVDVLVLESFSEEWCQSDLRKGIRHLDGNQSNNDIQNLEWIVKEIKKPRLTQEQIVEIKRLQALGWHPGKVAYQLAIKTGYVLKVYRNRPV